MRTNIEIDDELMTEMLSLSGAPTKKAAVEEAMRFYVQVKSQQEILKLAGKVRFYEGYDHKKMRENRRGDWDVDEKALAKLRKTRVAA